MFIAFDGIDGSGKSTQVELLCKYLKSQNVKHTKLDLGGCGEFRKIINKINTSSIKVSPAIREIIYYFEALYTNIDLIQSKKNDEVIIIDRYYLSYLAYGQLNGLTRDEILFFNKYLVEPDLYFFIDIIPETAYERIICYRGIDLPEIGFCNSQKINQKEKLKDLYLNFQTSVRNNYLKEIAGDNHYILDANKKPEELHLEVVNEIQKIREVRF